MKKKCSFASRCSCVFYAVSCAAFFSPYQDWHKSINHSKLNGSTCSDFMAPFKFRQLPRRSGSKNFPTSKIELFVTITQKGSTCFKVHFLRCCRAPGSASVQM